MPKLKLRSEEKFDANCLNPTVCSCSDSPPPPNYQPMADASAEAARLGKELGMAQLEESRRQYDINRAIAEPVVRAQLGLMNETMRQGTDYYNYMVANQRPVEAALNQEAMASGGQAAQDAAAARAIADSQGAYTRSLNQAFRQARRYGLNPVNHPASLGVTQAQSTAAMANAAREKEKALGYAKKMDVAGLYRGLPGASQGAYGVALNSGNSAVQNQMAPGNALLGGMAQGAHMQQTGMGQQLQGLGSILNAQASIYNNSSRDDPFGAILGAASNLGSAWILKHSDRRLKQDVVPVGVDENTGLMLYEFTYKSEPDKRYIGVMADEVESVMPDAVVIDENGYAMVNYDMLGIEMKEVHYGA